MQSSTTDTPSADGVDLARAGETAQELDHAKGAALMLLAMCVVPCIDVIAKLLGSGGAEAARAWGLDLGAPLPPIQVAAARLVVQAAALAPIVILVAGYRALMPKRIGLVALRGLLVGVASAFFFAGLQVLAVAEAVAIFFIEPLLLTLLSALILKEPIGWRRILAVVIGLAGAMLIVRPNFLLVGWAALLPMAAALCFAIFLTLTRMLSATENALTMHLWAGVGGGAPLLAALGCGALFVAEPGGWGDMIRPLAMSGQQMALSVALGLVAAAGHFLILLAFRRAPASMLAPLLYFEIISSTAIAYAVFGEFPGAWAWVGVAIIIASGVFVLWRERLRRSR